MDHQEPETKSCESQELRIQFLKFLELKPWVIYTMRQLSLWTPVLVTLHQLLSLQFAKDREGEPKTKEVPKVSEAKKKNNKIDAKRPRQTTNTWYQSQVRLEPP